MKGREYKFPDCRIFTLMPGINLGDTQRRDKSIYGTAESIQKLYG